MEAQRALQELESFRRHDDVRRKRTSAGSLAISTVTVKHPNRFCCGFVANRTASAAAGEGCVYLGHILFTYWLTIFVSFNDATNQRMTSGQSFFKCVNSFPFTTSCWRTASHSFCDTILECFT